MEKSSEQPFYQLVLIRNGESDFSKNNLFCGWTDSDISYKGECQSKDAGKLLVKRGVEFDIAFTSFLRRAVKTCHLILEQMGLLWIPIHKQARFGGCNKSKLALQHGDDQVRIWRREYNGTPPALSRDAKQHPIFESKYALLDETTIPDTECLRDAYERLLPFWNDEIVPAIKEGNRVLVVAHGSTLRALMKFLDHVPDEDIVDINIPPCIPLVYDFDEHMTPIRHYCLRDDEAVASAIQTAINETKLDPHPCI
ncbi:putative phosphoglycerate mutase [Echinococcus granulosus]|uniref:phosphoglycerate mutase (2,3-diphosphoglycerate-dependent) n=1 Tax=Echinococcus granulosus TaxID=6210 RepID=W6US55_ECHGR|nr:putative phosphoglycerate mutase [Echinococcus granulosus]EUB64490.1 putative phosphoglycerate mutase [Echinococcus granulosus]